MPLALLSCAAGFLVFCAFVGFGLRLGWQIAGLIF